VVGCKWSAGVVAAIHEEMPLSAGVP